VHEGENADESGVDPEDDGATDDGVPTKPPTVELDETGSAIKHEQEPNDSSAAIASTNEPAEALPGEEPDGNALNLPCDALAVPLQQSPWQRREALLEKLPAVEPGLSFEDAAAVLSAASLVVGLHPDQAAAEIVAFSAAYGVPFAVVPCCVYRAQFPARKLPNGQPVRTYDDLVAWCVENGPPGTESTELPFEGKNKVVFWRG